MSQYPPPLPPPPAYFPPPPPPPDPKSRKSMLSWPALIPLGLFVALQVIYGWPEAKLRASSPEYASSYLMGGIMAGFLLSLLIAWIVYRVASRSQRAGTIAFSVAMGLFCLEVVANHFKLQRQAGSNSTSLAAAKPVDLPAYGISLAPPAGWQRVLPDHRSFVVAWVNPESRDQDIGQMIMVEHEKATSNDVAARARELAKAWNGQVSSEQRQLNGEVAWEVKTNPPPAGTKPVVALITLHNGRFIFLIGGVSPGHSCDEELELVRQSWKWIPLESPSRHLEFRPQPLTALNGKITLNFPLVMTPYKTDEPDKSLGLSIPDFKGDDAVLEANLQLIELAAPEAFEVVRDRTGKGSTERLKLPEPFVWRALPGATQRAITQPVLSADGTHRIIFSLTTLDPKHLVLIVFGIYTADPQERSAYAATADKIVQSVSSMRP